MSSVPTIERARERSRTPTLEEWRIAGGKIADSALVGLDQEEGLLLGRRKRAVARPSRKSKAAKASQKSTWPNN